MQVTVQNASRGSGRTIAASASGDASIPPGHPEDEVDPQRRRKDPLLEPAHRADHVADVERLDLQGDPRLGRPLDDPAAGGRRRDERLVAEVHGARLDSGDVGLRLEARRPLLDRHVVGAPGGDHGQEVAAGPDPVDHVDEQLRPAARRSVVLAHVQVDDRRPGATRLDARVGDLLGGVGDVRVVLAEDVGPRDRDREHDRIAVPRTHLGQTSFAGASDARSASVIGRDARCSGSQSTSANSASTTTWPARSRIRSLVVTLERPRSRTAHCDRHGLEPRIDLASEVHRAPADHVLVAPDAVLLQECVASLLQVGQDHGVIDVAEPVEIAPPHLHPVSRALTLVPPGSPSASRSPAEPFTRSSA